MSVGDIRHYVLTETPCYLYVEALSSLEQDGSLVVVKAPPGRRRGTFAKYADDPNFVVRFQQAKNQGMLF
jgi:hypothetical protein